MRVARPALVVYAFAPKRLPSDQGLCAEAVRHLARLWEACTRVGMTDPVAELGLPTEFPLEIGAEENAFRLHAAKFDPRRREEGADYQAFLFGYQDTFGLIATLESHEEEATLARWRDLHDEWGSCAPEGSLPAGLLGEALLFHALREDGIWSPAGSYPPSEQAVTETGALAGEQVFSALPGWSRAGGAASFHLTSEGYYLWEGASAGRLRSVALIAPRGKQDSLFGWTAWAGTDQLAPFARYLVHAFKVRFAQDLFEREARHLRRQRDEVDGALKDLMGLPARMGGKGSIALEEFERAQHRLNEAQVGGFGLLYSLSRLKELILMVQVAERNLGRLVPAPPPDLEPSEGSLFRQDAARANWLRAQLEIELGYLEAVHQRAEEGHRIIGARLEFESGRNERELNRLVLLQGTLIGSLLAGLTAVQAFQPLPHSSDVRVDTMKWSLVAVPMTVALALPPLFAHWRQRYGRLELISAGLLGASLAWFGTALWAWALPQRFSVGVPFSAWLLYEFLVAAVGFLLGYRGALRLERIKGDTT